MTEELDILSKLELTTNKNFTECPLIPPPLQIVVRYPP